MVCCVAKVHDRDAEVMSYSINLLNLPTELLVKIMFYLPMHDRIMMLHISRRFC